MTLLVILDGGAPAAAYPPNMKPYDSTSPGTPTPNTTYAANMKPYDTPLNPGQPAPGSTYPPNMDPD